MDPLRLQGPLRRGLQRLSLVGVALLLLQFGLHRVEPEGDVGGRGRVWVMVDRFWDWHRGLRPWPGDGALRPGDQVLYRPAGVASRGLRMAEVRRFPADGPQGRGIQIAEPGGEAYLPLERVVGRIIVVM